MSTRQTISDFEAAAMPQMDDLYRTARRILGSQTEAEDVVQETYLQAWKSFHRFEPGTNIRAWMFKIMFHVIDHHRRKAFRLVTLREDEEFRLDQLTYEPSIPQEIRDEDMLAALDLVPEHYRAVILLVDVQEFSYKEVADALGVPIGTVMSRLNRGRKMLRTALTKPTADNGTIRFSGYQQAFA
ncbi:MAG TPA: sigma-70 family RNA polymerase sigma factor [Blastocatellia bacterium]|nr:sigma-70 family RNA polymerase sigma factor [Blastocatellia bacterium]